MVTHLESDTSRTYIPTVVNRIDGAIELLQQESFDVIVADLGLPDADGLQVVEQLRMVAPHCALIVASNNNNEDLAVQVIAAGAQDFFVKDYIQSVPFRRSVRFALERKHSERRLTRLAGTDELTGLSNRHTFEQRLDESLSRNRRSEGEFGVLYLDLDGFKAVNDRMGHDVGDELLRLVAGRIREVVRDYDICARLGGDEFAVLIEAPCPRENALAIADRLIGRIAEPYPLSNGKSAQVSASVGLAMHPQYASSREAMLRAADEAMYESKRAGGERCTIAGGERVPRVKGSLEARLADAVAHRELELHFQPIFDCRTERTVAVEALLRWSPSPGEHISPAVFVPILEETGLINSVGQWVLDESLAQLARWDELGYEPVRVHVNVSPRQFESGVLPDTVRAALQRHRLAPCRLELEITESTLMRNTRSSNDVLSSLKDLGVGLSIDDFGTGYSSLAYLHRFRVDTLKIDRSFVDQLGRSDDADAVTSAVLSLAQQLRLNVVAEGIETEAQLQFMKQRGCHFGQGFYYARPADAETVRHTLRGYKAELRHVAS